MINYALMYLNNSRIFAGIVMIMMNIGGRYVSVELPRSIDKLFNNPWMRRFFVFCIAFIATRDIKISILLTLLFVIMFKYLLNENSNVCILPKSLVNELDINKDGKIDEEEVKRAISIIKNYKEQKIKNNKNLSSDSIMN